MALPAAPAPLRMHGHVPMGLEVDGTPPKYTLRPPRVGCKVLSPAVGWAPGALVPPCLGSGGMGARPAPHGHCGTGAGRVGEGARPPQIHKKLWLCYSVSLWYQEKVIIN